jgi:hypothetical protein
MSSELLIHYSWLPCSVHTVYKAAKDEDEDIDGDEDGEISGHIV